MVKSCIHKKQVVYDFAYVRYQVVKITEPENRMLVARGWGRGEHYCLIGVEFQMYKSFGMDGADDGFPGGSVVKNLPAM